MRDHTSLWLQKGSLDGAYASILGPDYRYWSIVTNR
jgi:hypothetical protein